MAKKTQPEELPWSYVIHIQLPEGRIMDIEGAQTTTETKIYEFADKIAGQYGGTVLRILLKTSKEGPKKDRVSWRQEEVPALPAPACTELDEELFLKTSVYPKPAGFYFVHTTEGA